MTAGRLTRCVAALATGLLLTTMPASGQSHAPGSPVVVQPAEYFSLGCTGAQVGVVPETGVAYRCSAGSWVREDLPVCAPDPPSGVCPDSAVCQSPSEGTLHFCQDGIWRYLAAVAGPDSSTNHAIARFDGTSGQRLKNSMVTITDQGQISAMSAVLATPLAVTHGGTGASTAEGARQAIGAANDAAVVHLAGDETVQGNKTFTGSTVTRSLNEARHSGAFADIASAVADLPTSSGVVEVDSAEDDTTTFANTNPASPTTGKKDALVVDSRKGGIRFLSSMPEYPSASPGVREDLVPFVFQVRLDDPTRLWDSDAGAIGEWNCGRPVNGDQNSWLNCPYFSTSWGYQGGSKQFWHSGQCNFVNTTDGNTSDTCGGPHIFEVRYPEQPGVHESKPVFAVGNGGVSIYAPESRDVHWRGFLTMFRADDGNGDVAKANTPMFSFERYGAFLDGNVFIGNSLGWAYHTQHFFPQFNLWVQHDLASTDPAFVVESSANSGAQWEQGVLARIYDKTCCSGYEHRFGQVNSLREAFGFYANSVLRLASFTTTTGIERGQYIEWEGLNIDTATTRLRVIEPTARRDVYLPDQSGTVVVAPNSTTIGPLMWGSASNGNTVCQAAGLSCQMTVEVDGSGATRACDYAYSSYFQAMCRGSH